MKKVGVLILAILVILCGCSAQGDYESVSDVLGQQEPAIPKQVHLRLPEDAAAQVIAGDAGTLYLCDGYEVTVQTLSGGDLQRTLRELTGYDQAHLTVLETPQTIGMRYDFVWSAAGEAGDMVARAAVLDDGNYHYCLTVMAAADVSGSLNDAWREIFGTYGLD